MRIALTGGTGFIGQCLLRDYCDDHTFYVYTPRTDTADLLQHENVRYIHLDRPEAQGAALNDAQEPYVGLSECDAAINLGFARPKAGKGESFADYLPSITSADTFFLSCIRHGITNIVHVSTRSVYGKHMPLPHTEDEAIAPFSLYGAAKAASEAIASVYNEQGRAAIKILRLAQIIGTNEYQGVVSTNMKSARSGKALQIWGAGNETAREYLYVRDASAAIMKALESPEAKGVFNIGTGSMATVEELVMTICSLYDEGTVAVERFPEKKVEAVSFCMDVSKAAEVLGWKAAWSLPQALEAMRDDAQCLY